MGYLVVFAAVLLAFFWNTRSRSRRDRLAVASLAGERRIFGDRSARLKRRDSGYRRDNALADVLWGDPASRRIDLDHFDLREIQPGLARNTRLVETVMKRATDLFMSVAMLIILSPLLFLVALAIRFDSRGSVFYRQERVGLNGQVFKVIKFRSMVSDAERDGVKWASKNDSRITRVGHFIRKTRIDEIPQAFNVLKGEMSFVGPRPERPQFVEVLRKEIPFYDNRHQVKPGITGWAQVEFEYGASIEDARVKQTYDLYYIKNYSILFDFIIILKTFRVMACGLGSR